MAVCGHTSAHLPHRVQSEVHMAVTRQASGIERVGLDGAESLVKHEHGRLAGTQALPALPWDPRPCRRRNDRSRW